MREVKLKKEMDKYVVNNLIGDFIKLLDDIYLGSNHKHDWRCKCGKKIKSRTWANINNHNQISCDSCRYDQKRYNHKISVEKIEGYKYINSYFKGDKFPNGTINQKSPYLEIQHTYCGSIYTVRATGFINDQKRCSNCCQKYENSFAHYIEKELCEPLEKYWDYNMNTKDPYLIYRGSNESIYLYCQNKDYHGIYKTTPHKFIQNKRCNYCSGNFVHQLDSLGFRYPEVSNMIVEEIDTYDILPYSTKKFTFKCANCRATSPNSIPLQRVTYAGYSCKFCGDGIPITEKFVNNLLRQIGIKIVPQHIFTWEKNNRYDIYIPSLNIIIEIHGRHHYIDLRQYTGRSLEEEKANDFKKFNDAMKNNFEENKYIVIDARCSSFKYLKNSCIASLSHIFDLSKVDWDKVWNYSQKSLVKISCDLFNTNNYTTKEIADELELSRTTIIAYLKKGTELGMCNYDPDVEIKKNGQIHGKNNTKYINLKLIHGESILLPTTEMTEYLNIGYSTLMTIIKENHGLIVSSNFTKQTLKDKLKPYDGSILEYK